MNGEEKGVYLYCLAQSGFEPAVDETEGAFETPLLLHTISGITAVVEMVFLDVFCGPAGGIDINEPSWLIPRMVRHEKIIERVMKCSPVIPARFGTIFSSIDRLNSFLIRNDWLIMEFFAEVEDKSEWSVKGFLNRERAMERAEATVLEKKSDFLSALPSGRRYIEEKKIISGAEKTMRHRLKTVLDTVCGELSPNAYRGRDLPIIHGVHSRDGRETVFNRAFLVPEFSLPSFKSSLQRTADLCDIEGIVFEMSGPWPPYSFSPSLECE
jgi:hypothetical protein